MQKMKIDNNAFVYPMPMVLAGAMVAGKANFMAVGWVARVNFKPPLIAIALGSHHTNKGIEENRAFSLNIPGFALLEKTDYCGLVSGAKTDKSLLFDLFFGQLPGAPLIKQCPLCMACQWYDAKPLPSNTLYIGEIIEVFADADCLTDGQPDIKKLNPFMLTMPDNRYWQVGDFAGKAWSIGKKMKKG
jgi:flavin reductase (DIM6/NTAB) family NADH-FMN oxidoreductase RutF